MSKYSGRYCLNFYCDRHRERRCCADCWHKKHHKCHNPCMNDPNRCGLQDMSKPKNRRAKEENTHGTI